MKRAQLVALFAAAAIGAPRTMKAREQDYYIFNNGSMEKVVNSDLNRVTPKYWSFWVLNDRTIPRQGDKGHQCNSINGKTAAEARANLKKFLDTNIQIARFFHGQKWEEELTNCSGRTTIGPIAVMGGGVPLNSGKAANQQPSGGSSTTSPRFSRPNITGIKLDKASIDLLKAETEKLRLAGWTKDILAWSPLEELLNEYNAAHAAFSISQTNWEELAKSFSAVDKTVFYSLATDARNFANSDATWGNPQLKQFWNAMADFYASQAPEH